MISGAQTFIRTNTYYSLFPGLCIILTVIAFNTLGDGPAGCAGSETAQIERKTTWKTKTFL